MSGRQKQDTHVPEARREFARRLRELRIPRGYRTARSLARALDIDENRYTRYERAEVEPDLDMIRRICAVLGASPSDLLGTPVPTTAAPPARRSAASRARNGVHAPPETGSALDRSQAAWQLAELVSRLASNGNDHSAAAVSPLASVQRTGQLYRLLMEQPFEAITNILADDAVTRAGPEQAAPLRSAIDRLLGQLTPLNAPS